MLVKDVKVGDRIVSPFGHGLRTIVSIAPGMYGLIELVGKDTEGNRHLLSLDPNETVRKA